MDSPPRVRAPWLWAAGVVALLGGATWGLIHFVLVADLAQFVPHLWNDQTTNWHQALSFREVSFDSGYYTSAEHPAPVTALHFDVQGPAYAILFGTLARLIGWETWTCIPVNLALLGVGTVFYFSAARLEKRSALVAALCVAGSSVVLFHLVTCSQEALDQAAAIALAVPFGRLVAGERMRTSTLLRWVAFILVLSLFRFSWVLLLAPLLLLNLRRIDLRSVVGALLFAGTLTVGVLWSFAMISAPGGNSVFDVVGGGADPVAIGKRALANFVAFIDVFEQFDIAAMQRLAVVVVGIYALWASWAGIRRWRKMRSDEFVPPVREWLFHLYNVGLITIASFALYLPAGYFRLLGAHLLLSALVLVQQRRYLPIALTLIAANLVMGQSFVDSYRSERGPNFRFAPATLAAQRSELAKHVRYEPNAPTPWCNTLVMPVALYDYRVTLIPAGIGVSYTGSLARLDPPVKSRWVLLDATHELQPGLVTHLRPIASLAFGRLFLNLDSPCPPPRAAAN